MWYSNKEFKSVVAKVFSKSDICRKFDLPINGTGMRIINAKIAELGLDISHFRPNASEENRKYPVVEKKCPACGKKFKASSGAPREKITCSRSCSNTFFRSGKNNPNWKDIKDITNKESLYRRICFEQHGHERKCIICGWDISIDVHHMDGNKKNNGEGNLVPLCANHHRMVHMKKHKKNIQEQVLKIVEAKQG